MRRCCYGLVLLIALSGACGPIPQPFKSSDNQKLANPLLDPRDGVGVTVVPVTGAPPAFSGPLAELLVTELQKRGVPASSSGRLTNSLLLEGRLLFDRGNPAPVWSLVWSLRDSEDRLIEQTAVPVPWVSETEPPDDMALIDRVARDSADALAVLLRPGAQGPVSRPVALLVAGVYGAPGDGNRSLNRALQAVLREADIPLTENLEEAGLSIFADVTVVQLDQFRDRIDIIWTILDADGAEFATLSQGNTIPHSSLSGRWGPTAYDIARANLDAISGIMRDVARSKADAP